ncbi:kinesin light chain [Trichoderma arundinaceum]|uniref:Kinesin light chain n=1 Tax=Trichoderma arundinaceum TaxID=490622 RepID=A0A395NBW3_TRIAR|nr:kinesin light chain [Trichoderma arundinaceum]
MMRRPSSRDDFEVAIICALPLEYDAVSLLFDELWGEDGGDAFGRAAGDPNTYRTGRIGKHAVVLALLSHMGKASAAAAAASMRFSYKALRMVILAGICGGVPYDGQTEIVLGDVVIGKSVVQYDFGRKYPNEFMRKDTAEDNLGKPDKNIRNLLAVFNTESGREKLQDQTAYFLKQLQEKAVRDQLKYRYPGTSKDKLFESSYRHKHRVSPKCICGDCHGRMDPICAEAITSSCDALQCDERYLVRRKRLQKQDGQEPVVHIGIVASGDTVMKSGEDRDRIAEKEGVIAFEMEGAGIWEEMPCLVVKGVCDYADCHKNKEWQNFAAATAASASKAILEQYTQSDRGQKGQFLVSFGRNQSFVGRETILSELMKRVPPVANKDDCQRTVVEGLGGVGKTQIALEAVYRIRDEHPDCSVFWVPTVNAASFEKAYRDIGKQLQIARIDEDNADVKRLVQTALSEESSGSWLMVVDNADDEALLCGDTGLLAHLPFSKKGSILFTTRNHEISVRLDMPAESIIHVAEMGGEEALGLLRKGLKENQMSNIKATKRLLDFLANLPLAIRQASAYMAAKQMSTLEYLELCESEHRDMIDLLSRDFEDRYRYKEIQNPVATTWLISFNYILQHDKLAAEYLQLISIMAEKDVPRSLLPESAGRLKAMEAIGTLKAYAFITQHEGKDSFDMHRLVRLAMRNWLENKGELKPCVATAIHQLNEKMPFPRHENKDVWMEYLPHAQAALEFPEHAPRNQDEAELWAHAAESLHILCQYQRAEQMYRQALELMENVKGRENPSTISIMNNLASVLIDEGRYKEAEQMYQQLMELWDKMLGNGHPETISGISNLADPLSRLINENDREALKFRKQMSGVDYANLLTNMNNFANTRSRRGDYKEAEKMHRQILELRKAALGKDHPDTLSSMYNVADTLQKQGRDKEAGELHQQSLTARERVLGKEHPDTLSSMNSLALVFACLDRYKEAKRMHQQTLERRRRVLGEDHPSTISSISGIADALFRMGKYKEAEEIHRQTLHRREEILGKEHPDTLINLHNLASVLASLDRSEEAEQLHRKSLEMRQRVLGKEHPNTLTCMHNLAGVLSRLGRYEESEQMYRQTLEMMERVLGNGHPNTILTRDNLAKCMRERRKKGGKSRMSLSRLFGMG